MDSHEFLLDRGIDSLATTNNEDGKFVFVVDLIEEYAKIVLISEVNSLQRYLDYEILSSWWASWIGWNWGQELSARYFAWKSTRKFARYKRSKAREQHLKKLLKGHE